VIGEPLWLSSPGNGSMPRRTADDEERRVDVMVCEHAQDRGRAPDGLSSNVSATMR
jgi:hypothetical protein